MVERFDLVQYEHFDQLDRAVNGDWVRYSDHEAELSALKKQVEELTKALNRKVDEKCAAVQARTKAEAEIAALREAEKELACHADFIHRLQAALAFWMPGVHESIEIELNGRPGDDAMLLAGFEGEVPAESWGDRTLTRAAAAEAVAAELRKALAFYADVSKYPAPLTGGMGDLWADCGQIARAALEAASREGRGK